MAAGTLRMFRLLGRSGLRVSPLALGTMTFGSERNWGADESEARAIFERYVDLGGNLIDTANQYTNGTAECLIGKFAREGRDRLVIATKYTVPTRTGDPNSGGNHRKSMVSSVELSLQRMQTEYIDLLFLHLWDGSTRSDEILRAMDDLVRAGKVLYLGISNTPAWRVAGMQAVSDLRGWSPLIALQVEYSLIERGAERDLIPMAHELGLGVMAWAPLGDGILTGKYSKADLEQTNSRGEGAPGRLEVSLARGVLTPRALAIAEVVKDIAAEIGRSPSQIALAWTLSTGVTTPIIGARTLAQLQDNLAALEITLSEGHCARLQQASAVRLGYPHDYLQWVMQTETMSACVCGVEPHC